MLVWNFCPNRICTITVFKFLVKYSTRSAFIIKFTRILLMPESTWTCSYLVKSIFRKNILVLLSLLALSVVHAQPGDELKVQADKLFKEEKYDQAYKFYSQLVSNFPKDPEYNFRLGVCMIYSEPDKTKCIPFLKTSAANTAEAPKEVLFYLGKAYHINYRFDEAIRNYNEFKKTASSGLQKKLQVDREIASCNYGKRLLSNVTDLVVLNKKELAKVDYFRSYDMKKMGKLLAKPDEFKTSLDKKKKENSIVFLPSKSDVIYFSSYGDDPATGKDIYTSRRVNGVFGKPEKVQMINTEFDEDFPFLHPDGKTLYFASKGFNSMGGYDIFRSTFNQGTQTWNAPVNMEFPVNSPDDDFLYVTDSLETVAFFSTGRQSPPGKIDVLKVKTKRRAMDMLAVKGQVKSDQSDQSLASVITVKIIGGPQEIGKFNATEEGNYSLEIPSGLKIALTVETPGMQTQTAEVLVPATESLKPMRQTISYENGQLSIENSFDETAGDDSYLEYLNVIEKKAKLNVNGTEGSEDAAPLAAVTGATTPGPTSIVTPRSNKELGDIARKDAEESRAEAALLRSESQNAIDAGTSFNSEAQRKKVAADLARDTEPAVADSLLKASERDAELSTRILAFGNTLAEDAERKEKEAALNEQYSSELAIAITTKDPQSIQKLADLQKQIEELSKQENASAERLSALKSEIAESEKVVSQLETENQELSASISELSGLVKNKELELDQARKKKEKERLAEELANLRLEKSSQENELETNKTNSARVQDELGAGKKELSVATTLRESAIAAAPKSAPATLNAKQLRDFYASKILSADNNDKGSIQSSNTALMSYNNDLEAALERSKALQANLSPAEKQAKAAEIQALENDKKLNQTRLASNENRLKELAKIEQKEKVVVETNSTYRSIKADNPLEAMSLINEISSDLQDTEDELFSINYKSPTALQLRNEASASLNSASAKQNQVLEELRAAKEQLQKVDPNSAPEIILADSLTAKAEVLSLQAQELRDKASAETGPERDNLITRAKKLEDQASDQNIAASEITSQDKSLIFAANKENIQNLIKLNLATEEDITAAKRLSDEAFLSFRKAGEIRTEAKTFRNKGSKLGSYSNAEDLESEAILKQEQAIALLMQTSGDFELKIANTSVERAKVQGETPREPGLNEALSAVNTGLVELGDIKLQSYQKLYQANAAEIEALNSEVMAKESVALQTPSLKTELLRSKKLIGYAIDFKNSSDAANETNEKFNFLVTAVKQQNLAQQKLAELKFNIDKAETQAKTAPVVTEVVAIETTVEPTQTKETTAAVKTNDPIAVKQKNTNPPPKKTVQTKTAVPPSKKSEPVVVKVNAKSNTMAQTESRIIDISEVAKKDTSSNQVITYLDSKNQNLKNEEAGSLIQASLARLKSLEIEMTAANEVLRRNDALQNNAKNASAEPAEMRTKADALLDESEKLSAEAAEAKASAAKAAGLQRDAFLTQARELEKESQEKMMASAQQMQMANDKDVRGNSLAIQELLELLNKDDADAATALRQSNDELTALKTSIRNLRAEVEAQTNPAAKMGAIGNAEEKEVELLELQGKILSVLRQRYPDYTMPALEDDLTGLDPQAEEKRKELIDEQYTQMINLTNGFSLEYETAKLAVPAQMTDADLELKKNADELNAESKRLLIASAMEPDYSRRMRLLALAAKYGNYAVEQLAQITQPPGQRKVAQNNKKSPEGLDLSKVQMVDASQPAAQTEKKTRAPQEKPVAVKKEKQTISAVPVAVTLPSSGTKVNGIKIAKGNAYTNANPIPINAPMEQGLVFRVQIGAFKTPIPNNAFKGLSPMNGETTASGYIRYTAGNFEKMEGATAVKNDLRRLGYVDAFVVAYLNGKRISISDALSAMKEKGILIDEAAPKTAGITANENIPLATQSAEVIAPAKVAKELEKSKALLYTIQIGVFSKQATVAQLRGLTPVCAEALNNGLFRYTAGIYSSPERVVGDKNKVANMGFRDAFVSAYRDGKRISFAEARTLQQNDPAIQTETENPVLLGNSTTEFVTVSPSAIISPSIVVYTNSISTYPEATEENGIKTDEKGICYKIQLGAFSKEVPEDMVNLFNQIKNWPVEYKIINGLYVYTAGNYSSVTFAAALRDEIKELGLQDAYLTVYRDSNKVSGTEAEELLRE